MINDGVHRHKMTIDESITDRRYPNMQSDMSVDDLINTQKSLRSLFLCLNKIWRLHWQKTSICSLVKL